MPYSKQVHFKHIFTRDLCMSCFLACNVFLNTLTRNSWWHFKSQLVFHSSYSHIYPPPWPPWHKNNFNTNWVSLSMEFWILLSDCGIAFSLLCSSITNGDDKSIVMIKLGNEYNRLRNRRSSYVYLFLWQYDYFSSISEVLWVH